MAPRRQSQRHPSHAHSVAGPVSFLNPTKAYIKPADARDGQDQVDPSAKSEGADAKPGNGGPIKPTDAAPAAAATGVYHLWRSRDNRKGRHAIIVPPRRGHTANGPTAVSHPDVSNSARGVMRGLWKMVACYPVWDVSYDVATIFTLGSIIWVFNGFFVWLPEQSPDTEFGGEVDYGGGITAFIGATIFEIGSVLLMFEAVNESRTQCFGWALEEALEDGLRLRPRPGNCSHHHAETKSLLTTHRGRDTPASAENRSWAWWPTREELRTHYFREIGFLACLAQFIGATIFWIAGLTGLPPIYDALSVPVANGIYWLPQVVGGSGFIISGWLFMLETQPNWYRPAWGTLGWHIGFWNLVGAIGFTLCGALGFASENESAAYASVLATFIGSWAFLIGSVIQWYESLNKYPINISKKASAKYDSPDEEEESQDS
ncbi:hypothetical protein PFICI_07194 [Pestalotiopsis fici W106-1]|uniref:Integral membrane protein n=1 Tax=Pestalotiopsis fici (strain W106-1 / CGMCC3.15140) TaxID=1229662 RepID=W3X9W0_PESFW|nr:uncharacterized protein PFICI_07194 [Pestalotiopsis fici W106-1]ETS82192.1 hypothetical protein PFICI_07194 [Pestalotiopsis fici W106-1]